MISLINMIKTLFTEDIDETNQDDSNDYIGGAIVTQAIVPGKVGQVKFQGSWWTARSDQQTTLITGRLVQVICRQNITLYVR